MSLDGSSIASTSGSFIPADGSAMPGEQLSRASLAPAHPLPTANAPLTRSHGEPPALAELGAESSGPVTRSKALPSTNIIDLVMHEHRLAERLYWEFKNTEDRDIKQKKIHLLIKELSQHGAKEEMVMYPVMKSRLPGGPEMVAEALQEHLQVKVELKEMDDMQLGVHADLEQRVHRLMADVSRHVQEEETQLLPTLRQHLSESELQQLGRQFLAAASKAPSRPHPEAPQEGFMAAAANASAKLEDALKDTPRDLTKDSGMLGWAPKASGDSAAAGGKSLTLDPQPSIGGARPMEQ